MLADHVNAKYQRKTLLIVTGVIMVSNEKVRIVDPSYFRSVSLLGIEGYGDIPTPEYAFLAYGL